jgi:hypothetical protein
MNNPDKPPPNKEKLSEKYTERLRNVKTEADLYKIGSDILSENCKLVANFKFIDGKWEVDFTDN